MAYRQREINPTAKATVARLTGLQAIAPALDLGDGLSVAVGQQLVADYATAVAAYNQILRTADEANDRLLAMEKVMTDFNKRTLGAVCARFGDDSAAYELAGGTRRSARKKPVRYPRPAPPGPGGPPYEQRAEMVAAATIHGSPPAVDARPWAASLA